jgi:cyclopropane fatty-acyl-phospholipid synthase-like methyltransferase
VREYDLIADWYPGDRGHTVGVPEAMRMAAHLKPEARILDIGCGNGHPITEAFLDAGFRVIGLDTSAAMLGHFRANLPRAAAVRAPICRAPFRDSTFDAAHAWGVMFHLTVPEQRSAIARVSQMLTPGGYFLFTSGDEDDTETPHEGTMNGVVFRYYSMNAAGYRATLAANGMALLSVEVDARQNGYYLARKAPAGR